MIRCPVRLVRFLALVGLLSLLPGASAWATPSSRIINGTEASPGEYPAQGYLEQFAGASTYVCGGTLVSPQHFLTAAHCASSPTTGSVAAATAFRVTLGVRDLGNATASNRYGVTAVARHASFDKRTLDNDVALMTLSRSAGGFPLRLIETSEPELWEPADTATIIGWGTTESGALSDRLLEAQAPIRSDSYCSGSGVYGSGFHPATMICAGNGETDTCQGDSGGPLMVSDGAFFALVGITSWGYGCADPVFPGIYTRLGATALNAWVRDRVPMARITSVSDAAPDPSEPVTFSATATKAGDPGYFTSFAWDFDGDGVADDFGPSVTHAYATNGRREVRVEATGAGTDRALARTAVQVGPSDPNPAPSPTPDPTPEPTVTATPTPSPTASANPGTVTVRPPEVIPNSPLTALLAGRTARVDRRGRFLVRVRFGAAVVAGSTATIDVYRGTRKMGTARVTAAPGLTALASVRLTPAGRAKLRAAKRLKITLRLRVGNRRAASRSLTLRR